MKMQILILLATVLAISCGQYEESEVLVEIGSVAVLPCMKYSLKAHSTAVHWKKSVGDELKTVWRRDRSGLEFRPVGRNAPNAHCPQPNFGKGDYSLHIEGVREEDGGMYHCMVEDHPEMVIKKVMLRILKVSFTPADVTEGDDVRMTCSITPQSERIMTRWKQDGLSRNMQTSLQLLLLKNVSQKDSGTWSCLVQHKNTAGTASASLQVQGILVPKDSYAVVYAELGSSVTLPCIFSDVPIFNTMSWKKVPSTTTVHDLLTPFKNSSGPAAGQWDMSTYIKTVEKADQGIYKCSGQMKRTDGKRVERHITLVTAQVLSSTSSSSGRVTLTCNLSSTSHVTHYEWLRLDYGENSTQTLNPVQKSTSKVLNIPKGEEHNLGGWVCRFYEQQKLLGSVTYHQQIMSASTAQSESGKSKKVIMVIGLSLLSMLVLLILLQMYKNHRRRKMIMQYPAMETIVHLAANERERREKNEAKQKELGASCSVDLKSTSV